MDLIVWEWQFGAAHWIQMVLVGGIATNLVAITILLAPKLARLNIPRASRGAFHVMMVALAGYLYWVAWLFADDRLIAVNYSATLWAIRAFAFAASAWFLGAVLRCGIGR